VKSDKTVLFLALGGENKGSGGTSDPHFLYQVHMGAAFQTHRDEPIVESGGHLGVGMGLTDQPVAVGSTFHIKFQHQGW